MPYDTAQMSHQSQCTFVNKLSDACLDQRISVLLQVQARDELVDYVCKKEMGVYSQIFTPVGDTAQLDRVGM